MIKAIELRSPDAEIVALPAAECPVDRITVTHLANGAVELRFHVGMMPTPCFEVTHAEWIALLKQATRQDRREAWAT